ncbi:site-specific integrase, partial [Candidatus Bathyarchaeota archaeon]|nr:site-specific integrase [Candidatus Bathyarchaeota archaeon]
MISTLLETRAPLVDVGASLSLEPAKSIGGLRGKSKSKRIFGKWLKSQARLYYKQRRKIADKLQNPRILGISFHTFRHWKASMEYHKTKDLLHVMKMLGHRNIQSTLVYTRLTNFENDEYHAATAKTLEEA